MPQMIKDGTGHSYLTQVNQNNQLQVSGVLVTEEHYVNHTFGQAYNIIWDLSVTSGSDVCTLYIKNTGTNSIIFEGFVGQVSSNMEFYAKWNVEGIPDNKTDMTVGNLNGGSNNVLNADVFQGDGITGLTSGDLFWKAKMATSNQSGFVNFDADLILPTQQNLAIFATSGGFTSLGFFICYVDQGGGI